MSKYLFGDQYARLEAIRAYLQAAGEIANEMRLYENRQGNSSLSDAMDELKGDLRASYESCQDLIEVVETETAIEDGNRPSAMLPPPLALEPDPFPLIPTLHPEPDLDEPFHTET